MRQDGTAQGAHVKFIFDWVAQDSVLPLNWLTQPQREVWLRLAVMWATAARQSRADSMNRIMIIGPGGGSLSLQAGLRLRQRA